ncbi:MAG: hypothetical protein SFT68_05710 [Rickettsiaceae bacterium]|nr:hypothetical protein [Rickettsiaceae bacterium]
MSVTMPKYYSCQISNISCSKEQLFRFVLAPNGNLCIDTDFNLPGQVLLVSKDENLTNTWLSSSYLSNYFNCSLEKEKVIEYLLNFFSNKILSLLALAKKSGAVYIGKSEVRRAIKKFAHKNKECSLIIQARDASLQEKFQCGIYEIIEIFSSEKLSMILGKNMVKYVCLFGNFANKILEFYKEYKFFNKQR